MAPETSASTLNIYAVVCLPIFTVVLASENMDRTYIRNIGKFAILFSAGCLIINNYIITNAYYMKVSTYYEQTMLFENRLLARIEMTEGFNEDMPVAIISDSNASYLHSYDADYQEFPIVQNDQGLWNRFIGLSVGGQKTLGLMKNITGIQLKGATTDEINSIKASEDYKTLTVYPDPGSMKIINGILAVNFIYNFDINISESDSGLVYRLAVPKSFQGDYETAWYFYKDDTMVDVQWYQATDTYEAVITEPGQYYVTCFVRSNGKSVTAYDSEKYDIE